MPSHRPAQPAETLRHAGLVDAPVIALFETEAAAEAAGLSIGPRMRRVSRGVMTCAPAPGLREDLYAAGALLVMG